VFGGFEAESSPRVEFLPNDQLSFRGDKLFGILKIRSTPGSIQRESSRNAIRLETASSPIPTFLPSFSSAIPLGSPLPSSAVLCFLCWI